MHNTTDVFDSTGNHPADSSLASSSRASSDDQTGGMGTATISLILPAWNEAAGIATAVNEAVLALSPLASEYEIIVVDDGSTDDTAAIVLRLAAANERIRLIQHCPNQGYGAAIRSGFAAARNELVVFTDADCQFDLTELDRFVLLSNRYDIVCGYRIDRQDTPLRCFYSQVYNLIVRVLLATGVRDVDCAMKMFHRDVARQLRISGNGFLVNSEILTQANQLGCRIVEVGVSHRPRTMGTSTVSIRHIPKVLTSLARYWWNRVQFSSADTVHIEPPADVTQSLRRLQWGLLLVAAIFMLTNLNYPLIDRDETRYAEIPREMIATGNWLVPQLNFQSYYDKPPLLYWLCAISFKLFGVSEVAARLVPALAALGTLAATMFFGSRIFGRRVGLFAGVVLLLSAGFAFTSRYLLVDGLFSLCLGLSLFMAYEAIRPSRQQGLVGPTSVGSTSAIPLRLPWWIASSICGGLAFLSKGPISLVLWLPPVLAIVWLSETHAKPRWWHFGSWGFVAALIAVPWFAAMHQQDPEFLHEFFYRHNVARFAGEFHRQPFWYFVPVLLLAGHPWSFLTIPYANFLFGRGEAKRNRRPAAVGYLLLWSGWCMVFFSLSQCKLPTYLLPAAPALALMIGHYLNEVLQGVHEPTEHFFARFWSARSATATTSLAGVAMVIYVMLATNQATIVWYGWAIFWTSLVVTSLLLLGDRHQAKFAWATCTGVTFLFAVMVMHQIVPAYSRVQTLFGESSPLVRQLAMTQQSPIATMDHEFSEVPFYLNRNDIPNFEGHRDQRLSDFVSRHGAVTLIVNHNLAVAEILAQLPGDARLQPVVQRGSANIYQITMPPPTAKIATNPSQATLPTR